MLVISKCGVVVVRWPAKRRSIRVALNFLWLLSFFQEKESDSIALRIFNGTLRVIIAKTYAETSSPRQQESLAL